MKLFTNCLLLLLSVTLLFCGCAKQNNEDQSGDAAAPDQEDTRALGEIYTDFMSKVDAEMPSLAQADETQVNEGFFYYFGLEEPGGVKETLVYEPVIGSIPFTVSLLRVESNASDLAAEIKDKINPNRWVCVTASYVETAVRGNVVLLVMDGDNARGKAIVDAFQNM